MAPSALSHEDGAPGAGAEDCITSARRFWRVELGSRPRRRLPRRRVFPAPLFRAKVEGQPWIPVGASVGPRLLVDIRGSPQNKKGHGGSR